MQKPKIETDEKTKFLHAHRQALRLQQSLEFADIKALLQCSGGVLENVKESLDCLERNGKCCALQEIGTEVTWYAGSAPG